MQVEPMKPMLKAPGTTRLTLKHHILLPAFAFNFNFSRFIKDATPGKFNGVAGAAVSLVTMIYGGVAIAAVALFG